MIPDAELLDRWRAGDKQAGSDLLGRYLQPLLRFFANKVDETSYHDLAQRTMMHCVEAKERVREGSSFRAYLFAIARNVMLMHFRKRSGRPNFDPGVTSMMDLGTSPSRAVARDQERETLIAVLRSLPLDTQLLIEMHYWEELPAADVAVVFSVDPTTVRTRLHRARAKLREALEQAEADPAVRARLLESFADAS